VSANIDCQDLINLAFVNEGEIRYYSLARHALINAFKVIGIHSKSRILLPEFLCRDLLAPVNMFGAIACWYEVDNDLSPLLAPEYWPLADVVLMVNYFGFPQNMAPFKAYADRTGAIIIEDNAHGFLSRDEDGRFLGCRVNFGIFSIRKTLRIPDGAALWIKTLPNLNLAPKQLPFIGVGVNPAQLKKLHIRSLPLIGNFLFKAITKFIRILRSHASSSKRSDAASESNISIKPEPWHRLLPTLKALDPQDEIKRRRSAYLKCLERCEKLGGISVSSSLPYYCVPYAYAFRGSKCVISAMQSYADLHGFDMVTWPDLPGEIVTQAPEHYRNIFLINLAW